VIPFLPDRRLRTFLRGRYKKAKREYKIELAELFKEGATHNM
jgi:hypothetical protein